MSVNLWLVLILSFACVHSLIIYRRTPKPKLVCREEQEWHSSRGSNVTVDVDVVENSSEMPRSKRSASLHEPVIFLNTQDPKAAADGDFDLVSDALSDEEKRIVKEKLIRTCTALKIN